MYKNYPILFKFWFEVGQSRVIKFSDTGGKYEIFFAVHETKTY